VTVIRGKSAYAERVKNINPRKKHAVKISRP
jgi:hypothetical protein